MRYSTSEFSGISSILKIDLKLFTIVMIIVFLGMITLFSVSSGDSSLMLKQGVRILIGLVAMILLAPKIKMAWKAQIYPKAKSRWL